LAVERINSRRSARDEVPNTSSGSGNSISQNPVSDPTVAAPTAPSIVPTPSKKKRGRPRKAADPSSAEGPPPDEKKDIEGSGGGTSVSSTDPGQAVSPPSAPQSGQS